MLRKPIKKNRRPLLIKRVTVVAKYFLITSGFLLTSSMGMAAPLQAQKSLTRAVNKCALISSASKRLQCFDQLTGRTTTVLDRTVVAKNPTIAKAAPPSLKVRPLKTPNIPTTPLNSGSNLKSASAPKVVSNAAAIIADKILGFGKTILSEKDRGKEVNSIDVVFTSAKKNALGKWLFKADNGQTWRQTDARVSYFRKFPFKAVINKGAMSAFYLKPADGSPAIKVRRVN